MTERRHKEDEVARIRHNAVDAGLANEHVVRFPGQHEAAGARQGIEGGFCESGQLVLAVAVGEKGKHEE